MKNIGTSSLARCKCFHWLCNTILPVGCKKSNRGKTKKSSNRPLGQVWLRFWGLWRCVSPRLNGPTAKWTPFQGFHTCSIRLHEIQDNLHRCHKTSNGVPLSQRTLISSVWLGLKITSTSLWVLSVCATIKWRHQVFTYKISSLDPIPKHVS